MTSVQQKVAAVVVLLIAVAGYGVFATGRDEDSAPAGTQAKSAVAPPVLDERALATAQALAKYPATRAELPFAREALRVADQEMDLAFAYAVRQLAAHPQPVTPEAQEISIRLQAAIQKQMDDSLLVTKLTLAAASSRLGASANDSLQLARARLELDGDEIDDAHEDLIHAGGDPQGRMQAMIEQHEAASRRSDSTHISAAPAIEPDGLLGTAKQFSALREKDIGIQKAIADADSAANAFEARHRKLDAQLKDTTAPDSASPLANTQRRVVSQKGRAAIEKRADNEHQLAAAYRSWLAEVKKQERSVAHSALVGFVVILSVILVWMFSDALLMRTVATAHLDRRRLERLRVVTRVTLQALGALLILIVIFGTPSNLGTIIGLAGAGLTVALKDFIVSFVGWLVLMGRDGVRIGDLVEINGVTGEVVELGVFNTVLHETGNWTDAGHPTGRRVTFTNSYAIEGHYFNFSTSGQWLWDEVRIAVPTGKDPYPVVEALKARVEEATAESAQLADAEWKGSSRSPTTSAIAAAPDITIRPVMGGVELSVRYITHAAERYQVRSTLYHAAVQLLGGAVQPELAAATVE